MTPAANGPNQLPVFSVAQPLHERVGIAREPGEELDGWGSASSRAAAAAGPHGLSPRVEPESASNAPCRARNRPTGAAGRRS